MKKIYKSLAQNNENYITHKIKELSDFWYILSICAKQIDQCLHISGSNKEQTSIILMARNILTEVFFCVDSLERGHNRPVDHTLRMIIEDFCLLYHISFDKQAYVDFFKGKLEQKNAINYTKKNLTKGWALLWSHYTKHATHHTKNGPLIFRQIYIKDNGQEAIYHLRALKVAGLRDTFQKLMTLLLIIKDLMHLVEDRFFDSLEEKYFVEESEIRKLTDYLHKYFETKIKD
jgi:hypothetical protein